MCYKIVKVLWGIYYAIFFRLRVHGLENVPESGAAILCSNHISNYDVVTLCIALNKLPTYLAKIELFQLKGIGRLFSWLLLNLDAIPVDRNKTDTKAYKAVLDKLKNGGLVGIFAHGTRVKDAAASDAKAGVALFAVKSGAPVIPTAIVSDYKLFGKIDVAFGEPVDFTEYKGKKVNSAKLSEISTSLMERVDALIKELK